MLADRNFDWLGHRTAAPPTYVETLLWRVQKDTRWSKARVREVPHGAELRFVIGGDGREDTLMQSAVYRHAAALEAMSAGGTELRGSSVDPYADSAALTSPRSSVPE